MKLIAIDKSSQLLNVLKEKKIDVQGAFLSAYPKGFREAYRNCVNNTKGTFALILHRTDNNSIPIKIIENIEKGENEFKSLLKPDIYALVTGGISEEDRLQLMEFAKSEPKLKACLVINYKTESVIEKASKFIIDELLTCKVATFIVRSISSSVEDFSLLKHRIAHLWLPLDIDLQGIREVSSQQSVDRGQGEDGVKYLKDVLNGKNNQFYRRKLADLWRMIGKDKVKIQESEDGDPCGKTPSAVRPSIKVKGEKENLECTLELIEKNQETKEKTKDLKDILLKLSGLSSNTLPLKPDLSSPIFQFMCLLDCGIKDKDHRNVKEILSFFQSHKFLDEQEKEKKFSIGGKKKPVVSFHDWFCALDECLDNLRDEIWLHRS